MLFVLLAAACTVAHAQRHVLYSPLPSGTGGPQALDAARHAFVARRWQVTAESENSFVARIRHLDLDSTLQVSLADGALQYADHTINRKGEKTRVPDRWIAYLRGDIDRALAAREPSFEAAQGRDPAERLQRLKAMLDSGLISRGEYDTKRAEILKGL